MWEWGWGGGKKELHVQTGCDGAQEGWACPGWAWPQATGLECRHRRNRASAVPGPGPGSGKKLPAPLLQPSASGPPIPLRRFSGSRGARLSAWTERGPDSSWGRFEEHPAPLLQNTRWGECPVLVPLKKKRKLATESAPSPQGLIAEQFDFN